MFVRGLADVAARQRVDDGALAKARHAFDEEQARGTARSRHEQTDAGYLASYCLMSLKASLTIVFNVGMWTSSSVFT
jgi:hypothetical protein